LRASVRKVAWNASSASCSCRSSRRRRPRTIGPCTSTSLANAASSPWRANLSSNCASSPCPVQVTRRKYSNTESSEFLAMLGSSFPYRGAEGQEVFNFLTERDLPMLWLGKRTLLIGFRVTEDDPYFDRYEVVSLVHIVRLEPIPHAEAQAS